MASIVSLYLFTVLFYCVAARHIDDYLKVPAFGIEINVSEECMRQWQKFNETVADGKETKNFYCSVKPSNYPEKEVDSYFERLKQKLHFSDSNEPLYDYTESEDCSLEQTGKNCCMLTAYEEPYWVRSENQFKLAVHTNEFRQRIRTAKCKNEEATCFKDFNPWSNKVQTHCRTDYGSMHIMVYNARTDTLESVPVSFPIYCSCHIEEESLTL